MSSATFILIPGRTSRQGCGISEGKFTAGYREEIAQLHMSPVDVKRLGLQDGDQVRVTGEFGEMTATLRTAAADELPEGILFIPYGDFSSRLMGGDTHGSGMPTSKGLDVTVELSSRSC